MKNKLPNISSNSGRFTDGDPATGALGTIVTAKWLNDVQDYAQDTYEEMKGVLDLVNLTPDPSRQHQLAEAIKGYVQSQQAGATNLLLNSGVPYSGNAYRVQYALAEAPAVGEEVVITLWGELGTQRTGIGVYNTHGFSEIARLTKLRDGVYQGKGVWRKPISNNQEQTPNDSHLNVYFYPSSATDNNRINRIQLERGNIGTDWKPNREDIKSDVQKETRTRFITVRGGSQAVTFDATKRSDWFREMQIPESGGWGYYIQAFHNSGTQHVYSNFPLSGRFYFTAEVFHSAGYSHVRITYPSQNRVFETAVNLNQEALRLDWREVVFVKDGVFQGSFKTTSELRASYRVNVERNDARFPPYSQLIDASVDISSISANKVIGEYFCCVKEGENDRAKSVYRTGILTDGNVFTELGQWNAENRYQVPWKSFSKTNNTAIGKTTDNERDRLQVNGTILATAPEAAANNDQVPTTGWVNQRLQCIRRTYSRTVNGDSQDDNGTTRTMNLTGEVIVYPDGKIEQIFNLQHFRDIWFGREDPAVGMSNREYWGRLIPIDLWTAMPQKVLYVDAQVLRSSNSNLSGMYTTEAVEQKVGWAIRKQGSNRGKVWIDIGRVLGSHSEHIDLIVKVEGY